MIRYWQWVSLLVVHCGDFSFSWSEVLCCHIPNNLHLFLFIVIFEGEAFVAPGHLFELALELFSPLDELIDLVDAKKIKELEDTYFSVLNLAQEGKGEDSD